MVSKGRLQGRLPVCLYAGATSVCMAGCSKRRLMRGHVDSQAFCKATAGPGELSAEAMRLVQVCLAGLWG